MEQRCKQGANRDAKDSSKPSISELKSVCTVGVYKLGQRRIRECLVAFVYTYICKLSFFSETLQIGEQGKGMDPTKVLKEAYWKSHIP